MRSRRSRCRRRRPRTSSKAKADEKAVQDAADSRTAATQDVVNRWGGALATKAWTETAFDVTAKGPKNRRCRRATTPCCTAKYTYWYPRPENVVRDLDIDKNDTPFLPTPRFPAYPSGSAGYAGGEQAIMDCLFPDGEAVHKQRADDQIIARIYAGVHWRFDAVSRDGGDGIAKLVIDKVKGDSVGKQA